MNKVKIGIIQAAADKNPAMNHAKAILKIRQAARRGAQIICLQELYRTLYFCQKEEHKNFAYAESAKGPSIQDLAALAGELKVVLVVPFFERRAAGVYHNSAAVIDADGSVLGLYRKMHIPDDPNFYEKFYFAPGDLGFKVFKTRYGRISVLICWDQWYPEGARIAALKGAQILFYPTAIGWHDADKKAAPSQKTAWETIQRSHAVANGVFVASPNRVGREGKLNFWGRSFISGPFGNVLAQAGEKREETLIAECDLKQIETVRQHWPFLRDRRIDAYGPITSRFIDE
ncbi:MAG: carbon-nitrogen hydrolase [Candidatus Omnitrophica bacterium]|nr:carbon-nitrogen hydrolase [Candidatus Omnitrophota bacterium]